MDFLDLGLHFNCLCDLKMVPKLTYGSHWGSQGRQVGVLGAGRDFVVFDDIQGTPQIPSRAGVGANLPGPGALISYH